MNAKKHGSHFLTLAWWKALLQRKPKTSLRKSSTSYRNADDGTMETQP